MNLAYGGMALCSYGRVCGYIPISVCPDLVMAYTTTAYNKIQAMITSIRGGSHISYDGQSLLPLVF